MDIELEPDKYVLAVSGGVDSVVLLDALYGRRDIELVVAHFDHGIRPDSKEDRVFVRSLAKKYGLPFEYAEGRLGPRASEATARRARYDFLEEVCKAQAAAAIITAHHQDDVLETVIINMLRGTGRKGLSSLASGDKLERPLLHVPKQEIIKYAKSHGLKWHEDSTNQEEAYLRNYIRRRLLPKFSEQDKKKLLKLTGQARVTNKRIDSILNEELHRHSDDAGLDRQWFRQLPHDVALEAMAAWLRRSNIRNFDRKMLERLVVSAKTGRSGQRSDVINGNIMVVAKDNLALDIHER